MRARSTRSTLTTSSTAIRARHADRIADRGLRPADLLVVLDGDREHVAVSPPRGGDVGDEPVEDALIPRREHIPAPARLPKTGVTVTPAASSPSPGRPDRPAAACIPHRPPAQSPEPDASRAPASRRPPAKLASASRSDQRDRCSENNNRHKQARKQPSPVPSGPGCAPTETHYHPRPPHR